MNIRNGVLMWAMIWLLGGCSGSAPGDPRAQMQPAAPVTADKKREQAMQEKEAPQAPGADADLGAAVKAGMAYADFRKTVLDNGWSPVKDSQCMANVVGDNHQQLCSEHPELALCKACQDMPELSSCSTDGYCVMRFRHAGQRRGLRVVSYGMTDDWNVSGEDSRLEISSWEFQGDPDQ